MADIEEFNKLAEYLVENSDFGYTFKAGLFKLNEAVMVSIGDASHASEGE